MEPDQLNRTEGMCLRYLAGSGRVIVPAQCVTHIDWSHLPHSLLSARAVFERLKGWGLIKRQKPGYVATDKGRTLVAKANKLKLWQTPPRPIAAQD